MLQVNGLSFKYKNKSIFDNYNLVIEDKGLVLLNEKSGFGKTTLVRLINNEIKPNKGSITSTFKSKSYLPQDFNLIDDKTVLENISLTGAYSEDLLQYFGLADYKNEIVGSLSLGQRQIVAFIRCYIQDAEFYIFDEPTQNMDVENTKKALQLINKLSETKAVLLITHEDIKEDEEKYSFEKEIVSRPSIETKNIKRKLFTMSFFVLIGILIGLMFPVSTGSIPYVPTFPVAKESLYSFKVDRVDYGQHYDEYEQFFINLGNETNVLVLHNTDFVYLNDVNVGDDITYEYSSIKKMVAYAKTSQLNNSYDYDFEGPKFYLTKKFANAILEGTNIPLSEFEEFKIETSITFNFGGYLDDSEADYIYINDYLYYSGFQYGGNYSMSTKYIENDSKYYTLVEGRNNLENKDEAVIAKSSTYGDDGTNIGDTVNGLECVGLARTNNEYFDRSSYNRLNFGGGWNFAFCDKEKVMLLSIRSLMANNSHQLAIVTDSETATKFGLEQLDDSDLTYYYSGNPSISRQFYEGHTYTNDIITQNIVVISTLSLITLILVFLVDLMFYYSRKEICALKESSVSLKHSLSDYIKTASKTSLLILFFGLCSSIISIFSITIDSLVVHVFILSILAIFAVIVLNLLVQLCVFILRYKTNFKRGKNL